MKNFFKRNFKKSVINSPREDIKNDKKNEILIQKPTSISLLARKYEEEQYRKYHITKEKKCTYK